ncbi:hypothetical protein GH714_038126 [Hevea brasiliensis]|uniref:Uncharacterized protein n=1 Tax=Hevea brasiliensis TaxID=3981 RepID=A0A6A6MMT3_HEVBR|nr:hypothetical protein GH714_038126 [Hevea brasiliensis]
MCLELYREYGTTMAGLKALGYEFDDDEFHAFAHGRLPYEKLKPDAVLRNLLLSLPQRKIIFTNADKAHAAEVLKRLGLEDCFAGIICFETLNPPVGATNYTDALENDAVLAGGEPKLIDLDDADKERSHPKPQILCKPSLEAIEAAIRIANVDPKRTVETRDFSKL